MTVSTAHNAFEYGALNEQRGPQLLQIENKPTMCESIAMHLQNVLFCCVATQVTQSVRSMPCYCVGLDLPDA